MDTPQRRSRRERGALDRLDDAALTEAVHALGPEGLAGLVADVGLADAGHWLALATAAQVLEVLDDAVWEAPVGEVERFDPARFVTWLEALVEVGAGVAADRLAEVPIELAVVGLYRQALVFDTDELWLAVARGLVDDVVHLYAQLEIDEHLLLGRGLDGWDAVVATMAELADRHPGFCAALLDRCRDLTDHAVGEAGLAAALEDEVEGEEEASLEREDRRARRGFVAPHAARSFLALAVEVELDALRAFAGRDPVTAAYFRDWERARGAPSPGLVRGGVEGARPEELGYLVQVVVAACERGGRRTTVEEAAQAVLAVCRVGESVAGATGGAVAWFRCGFHVLHHRVVQPARAVGDRTGLAEDVPRLDGRYLDSAEAIAAAERRLRDTPVQVEVVAVARDRGRGLPWAIDVPAAAAAALGASGATVVLARVGGVAERITVTPWDGDRWIAELPRSFCRALELRASQRVTLRLERVPPALPPALADALSVDLRAEAAWRALPEDRQRTWVEHVAGAGSPGAARRRAAFVVEQLRAGRPTG